MQYTPYFALFLLESRSISRRNEGTHKPLANLSTKVQEFGFDL
jgi:hypothetical protein